MVTLSPWVMVAVSGKQLTVGGRFFLITTTSAEHETWCFPSDTFAVMVYLPGATPVASKVTVSPEPTTFPPLADQVIARESPSGSTALTRIVVLSSCFIDVFATAQVAVGGS